LRSAVCARCGGLNNGGGGFRSSHTTAATSSSAITSTSTRWVCVECAMAMLHERARASESAAAAAFTGETVEIRERRTRRDTDVTLESAMSNVDDDGAQNSISARQQKQRQHASLQQRDHYNLSAVDYTNAAAAAAAAARTRDAGDVSSTFYRLPHESALRWSGEHGVVPLHDDVVPAAADSRGNAQTRADSMQRDDVYNGSSRAGDVSAPPLVAAAAPYRKQPGTYGGLPRPAIAARDARKAALAALDDDDGTQRANESANALAAHADALVRQLHE
jgi:DNA-binding protein H-NS